MNVQRIERVADLVGHTGGEQGQGLDAFAFDGLEGLLARLGGIVDDQGHAGAAFGSQRRRVEPQKARARIMHFQFMADHARPAAALEA